MNHIVILIIFLFSIIHFLEFSSFYSRVSGIETDYKLISYSIQQTTFVGTRFFFIFLMPLLGLIVDTKIGKDLYIYMMLFSLFGATLSYIISYFLRRKIIDLFSRVILEFNNDQGYIYSFYIGIKFFLKNFFSKSEKIKSEKIKLNFNVLMPASFIFCCYSIAVFLSFYFALLYYDYRSTIGQLSGVVNAFATLVLTLYIEPRISKSIDNKSDNAKSDIYSLLVGRFLGVAVISPLIIFIVVSLT